jgi:hypothetical protein
MSVMLCDRVLTVVSCVGNVFQNMDDGQSPKIH